MYMRACVLLHDCVLRDVYFNVMFVLFFCEAAKQSKINFPSATIMYIISIPLSKY